MRGECEHGSLQRSCEICFLNTEIDALKAENAKLLRELKNFLSAFDGYFELRAAYPAGAYKISDAKEALFSAAIQARAALAAGKGGCS